MMSHMDLLRKIPNFPNYMKECWGYPERTVYRGAASLIVFGPPLHLYTYLPEKICMVHVSGIPDWATMQDLVEIFVEFGKIHSIELSVKIEHKKREVLPKEKIAEGSKQPRPVTKAYCNGWALVTFCSYEGAQKACFAHMTRRIPGSPVALSIYKGIVNNVVLVKNLPDHLSRSELLIILTDFPGVVSIQFIKPTTARMLFEDLDNAVLFMDYISADRLVIDGFTCTVEPEDKDELDDD